jgi:Dullard-like phosphatase family protein
MENIKEKESNLLLCKRNETKSTINKNFHSLFNNSKTSLSKLLQSVYNYKKRTCNILFPTESNNNKNAKQINNESVIKNEGEQNKEKEQENNNIEKEVKKEDKKLLIRNPSFSSMTSHTSNISNKNENKKYACIASFNFSKNNNKLQIRKKLLNSRNNKNFFDKNNKNIIFEFNDTENKEEKNDEMIKIIEQLLNLEQHTVYLLTKIKIPEEFHKECTVWINYFTKTCLYEVKKYFNDNFTENNNNNNTNNTFLTNKNINNNTKDFYNQLNYSINILIISIIIAFWRTDINNIDLNININNYESIIKDLSEIMIIHHKIYLLICLYILNDSNYLDNNCYTDNKITQLKEQIKNYLPKKLSGNNYYCINNNLIVDELKSSSNVLCSIIKKILKDNKKNSIIYRLSKNLNNLYEIETSELVNYFYNYLNYHKNDFSRNLKINVNVKEYEKNANGTGERSSIPLTMINKNRCIMLNTKYKNARHRKIVSDLNCFEYSYSYNNKPNINNSNFILKDNNDNNNVTYNQIENNNYNNNLLNNLNNNDIIDYKNFNDKSFINNYYYNNYSTTNINKNKNIFNDSNYDCNSNNIISDYYSNNNNYDDTNDIINYKFNCRNNFINSKTNYNKKPEPPYLPNINNKNISKDYSKKITLILDLDETLVCFKINKYNPQIGNVFFRPGLKHILNKLYPLFDLVIWTVATKEYADAILDLIEKDKKYFSARLYREHATIDDNNVYVKDLNNLGRPLNSIIIVDDKESSYRLNKENGILIKPFTGSKSECQKDFVLYDLFNVLIKIMLDKNKDVRIGILNMKYEIQQKISNTKINE